MNIQITLRYGEHDGQRWIFAEFPYNAEWISIIRKIPGALWSSPDRCWLLPLGNESVQAMFNAFRGIVWVDASQLCKQAIPGKSGANADVKQKRIQAVALSEEVTGKLIKFKYWLQSKRYSDRTVKVYQGALKTFFRFFPGKPIHLINNDDIVQFNNDYILARKYSPTLQNQCINALKLFYSTIEEKELDINEMERPRKAYRLPNVLSKEEIKMLLDAMTNVKHRTMLSLLYGCGLRRAELLMLLPGDIDVRRMVVIIRNGKGAKDRIVPLSPKLLTALTHYMEIFKPDHYLFEGTEPGQP